MLKIKKLVQQPVDETIMQTGYRNIIGVGRLTDQKNFSLLIDSFADLVKSEINTRLIIFGEGPLRDKLESQIEKLGLRERVTLPGFVDNPYAYMSRADVFVLSSNWEGLPMVLIECLACGTKIVSTNCPSGPAEILEGGKYGTLVPMGDSKQLAKKIIVTLSKNQSRDLLQKRASDFNSKAVTKKYLSLLSV
jgi:glycosyltransferase involved in cell wall biosynthesis